MDNENSGDILETSSPIERTGSALLKTEEDSVLSLEALDDAGSEFCGGCVVEWTAEEQQLLEQGLQQFPAGKHEPLERYLKTAQLMPTKTAKDVCIRVQWMSRKEAQKKRKSIDITCAKKNNRNKERSLTSAASLPSPSQLAAAANMSGMLGFQGGTQANGASAGGLMSNFGQSAVQQNAMSRSSLQPSGVNGQPQHQLGMQGGMQQQSRPGTAPLPDSPDGDSSGLLSLSTLAAAIPSGNHQGSYESTEFKAVGQLLNENYSILNALKSNMAQFKVVENTELLVRFRDNVLATINNMNSMPGLMSHMPALPVQLNLELASKFLPPSNHATPTQPMPMPMAPNPMTPNFFNPSMGTSSSGLSLMPPMGMPDHMTLPMNPAMNLAMPNGMPGMPGLQAGPMGSMFPGMNGGMAGMMPGAMMPLGFPNVMAANMQQNGLQRQMSAPALMGNGMHMGMDMQQQQAAAAAAMQMQQNMFNSMQQPQMQQMQQMQQQMQQQQQQMQQQIQQQQQQMQQQMQQQQMQQQQQQQQMQQQMSSMQMTVSQPPQTMTVAAAANLTAGGMFATGIKQEELDLI